MKYGMWMRHCRKKAKAYSRNTSCGKPQSLSVSKLFSVSITLTKWTGGEESQHEECLRLKDIEEPNKEGREIQLAYLLEGITGYTSLGRNNLPDHVTHCGVQPIPARYSRLHISTFLL